MKLIGFIWLSIILYVHHVSTQAVCSYDTCGECISSGFERCLWCSEDGVEERCKPANYTDTLWCKAEFISKAPEPYLNITKDQEFGTSEANKTVQFRPLRMKVTTAPGRPVSFNMTYKPAVDYPLDVYYLMDTSYTMIQKVHNLKKQANQIYNELIKMTRNVRLGVGSFIEKPKYPYFDGNADQTAYAFKNHVSLTSNMSAFRAEINSISFGSNFDDPEAGLDALMQVMACDKELGWREGARRFIVVCTDSVYHSAGDGKMLGIIKPNDMQCHVEDNMYTMQLELDYPSVSQINKIATDKHMQIIFAVTKEWSVEYQALSKQIIGAHQAELIGDSSVVDIIKNKYQESVRYISLTYKELPSFVQLQLEPDCRRGVSGKCISTPTHPEAVVTATLTVTSCPSADKLHQEITISPVGLNDSLMIELDIICQCECEKSTLSGALSPKCNKAGYIQCGICKCNEKSYGNNCQCSGNSNVTRDYKQCIAEGDTQICSGRGTCTCGKCEECKEGFSGSFCQYNDDACPHVNKLICAANGRCKQEKCQCFAGWTGEDCNCILHKRNCIAPRSKDMCSGNGECVCGKCECNKLKGKDEKYSGLYCDTCEECAEKRCKELEDYAHCNYMNNKTICDNQFNATDVLRVEIVNKTIINGPAWYAANWCKKVLDDGSQIIFKYMYEGQYLVLAIQNEPQLPPKANIWVAVGSAIGAVLLIGLLTLLIWKCLIDLHDAKEYDKFAKESAAAGYDVAQNPLYETPTTNFSNPTFNHD